LQERLQQDVILMVVREHDVIYHVGQIFEREARHDGTLEGLAHDRVGHDAHVFRFENQTGVSEITEA
jgi:hypothetical protein